MRRDPGPELQRAEALLLQIPRVRSRLRQRLMLAAALTVLFDQKPIVVGGTAEEYWAGGEYHPTDLDLCPRPSDRDLAALRSIRLVENSRHWVRPDLPVAVEFPGTGDDIQRTSALRVAGVSILMISCEDLYLDRVRHATTSYPREDTSFDGALEIALSNYGTMDWDYIRDRLRGLAAIEAAVGQIMIAVNRRARARARRRRVQAVGP